MMHKGVRTSGGDMSGELTQKVDKLLDEFGAIVQRVSRERNFRRAFVRSRLPCNLVALLDADNLFILAEKASGMPSSLFFHAPEQHLAPQGALDGGRWDFGMDDPFVITFPKDLLEQREEQRRNSLEAIAATHVDSEIQRALRITSLVQINPLFGPASYVVDERLVFVLMPFTDELTRIYISIIKPTVEAKGLVCRRADDFKTNKAIIQDIWKAICEARVIIADLTSINPNVMYELGIAHTVGKETILIYQRSPLRQVEFPFDLAHIRRIEYEDSAVGGKKLERDLSETLSSILKPAALSQD